LSNPRIFEPFDPIPFSERIRAMSRKRTIKLDCDWFDRIERSEVISDEKLEAAAFWLGLGSQDD
jgi:hypothetical protein